MKAPYRIWIDPLIDLPRLNGHINNDSVEYTRTDAFIEKAEKWIKDNGYMYNGECKGDVKAMAEDFVNYIKGE